MTRLLCLFGLHAQPVPQCRPVVVPRMAMVTYRCVRCGRELWTRTEMIGAPEARAAMAGGE